MRTIEEVLAAATHVETPLGHVVALPEKLPRKLYEQVDKFLLHAGAQWNRSVGGHLFDQGLDGQEAIATSLEAGAHLGDDNAHDFFPTRPEIAASLVRNLLPNELLWDLQPHPERRVRVFEPSAGRGALLTALFEIMPSDQVDAIVFEIDPRHQKTLESQGLTLTDEGREMANANDIPEETQGAHQPQREHKQLVLL